MDLIVWLLDGQTMKFENVFDIRPMSTELVFKYTGVSTGRTRHACFQNSNIVGWAHSID